MSRRRSKFAPNRELSLEELMPSRGELEKLGSGSGINPERFAIRSEEAGMLRDAIQKLPAAYRIVLVLRDMEGLSDEDVAEITGLRAGTVRVRLHRARLFVRKELTRAWKPLAGRNAGAGVPHGTSLRVPKPPRCKAMFAELSNYLDEQLDDSLCEEMERHLDGCGPCKVFLASLEATIEQCRRSPAENPTGRTAVKLRKELMKNYNLAVATIRP
jgi:RNA polymerase sigma-70 factor (ECF subfamily)